MYIEHVASKTQLIHREVAGKVEVRIECSPASQEETPASQEEIPASRRILWIGQLYISVCLAAVHIGFAAPGPRAQGPKAQGGKGPRSQGGPRGEGAQGPRAQGGKGRLAQGARESPEGRGAQGEGGGRAQCPVGPLIPSV